MSIEISKERLDSISVKDCFTESLDIFKNNFIGLFIACLLVIAGSVLTLGILFGPLMAGYIDYIQKIRNKEENITPTHVFSKLNILIPTLIIALAAVGLGVVNYILGTIFGHFISFLTGLIAMSISMAFFTVAIPLVSDGKTEDAGDALKVAWETYMKNPLLFFLLVVINYALTYLGMLMLGVGIAITVPLSACIMALASIKLKE